jgi:hypothetical protein
VKTTIFIFGILAYSHVTAQCSFKGPGIGFSFSNNNSIGSFAWANPSNAKESDDVYAASNIQISSFTETSTYYLVATDFGFAIPANASICGIEIQLEKHYQVNSGSLSSITDKSVRIVIKGTPDGDDKAAGEAWLSEDEQSYYGSISDKWGLSLTTTDINSSTFGVAISASVSSGSSDLDMNALIDQITITVYYNSLLPVTIKEFRGAQEQDHVRLTWVTASESNSSHFIAEKMINDRWAAIDSIPAAVNSADDRNYLSIDRSPGSTNMYRIMQVDIDGHFIYSRTIKVNFSAGANIIIRNYPNPVHKILTIESSAPFQWVQLTDQLGKVVLHKEMDIPAYTTQLNLAHLPSGVYMLTTDKSAKQAAQRIVINK